MGLRGEQNARLRLIAGVQDQGGQGDVGGPLYLRHPAVTGLSPTGAAGGQDGEEEQGGEQGQPSLPLFLCHSTPPGFKTGPPHAGRPCLVWSDVTAWGQSW